MSNTFTAGSVDLMVEDPGTNDTHTCVVNRGDGTTGYDAPYSQSVGLDRLSHAYTQADVHAGGY